MVAAERNPETSKIGSDLLVPYAGAETLLRNPIPVVLPRCTRSANQSCKPVRKSAALCTTALTLGFATPRQIACVRFVSGAARRPPRATHVRLARSVGTSRSRQRRGRLTLQRTRASSPRLHPTDRTHRANRFWSIAFNVPCLEQEGFELLSPGPREERLATTSPAARSCSAALVRWSGKQTAHL